ncbi:hypothetical protein N7522_006207 [Penicillium canescens]|nr:hypothetical protein N7522_006207 [Penicillium canescens]
MKSILFMITALLPVAILATPATQPDTELDDDPEFEPIKKKTEYTKCPLVFPASTKPWYSGPCFGSFEGFYKGQSKEINICKVKSCQPG